MKRRVVSALLLSIVAVSAFVFVAQKRSSTQVVHIEGEIFIPKPVADVWTYIATDFDKIQDYSAGVKKSYFVNGHFQPVVGSERRCELVPEGFVDERITEMDINRRVLAFEVTNGDVPIKMAVGTWELHEAEGGTRVVEKADFRMEWFFMNGPARSNFERGIHENLAGLKNLVMNGESATAENISSIMSKYWEE